MTRLSKAFNNLLRCIGNLTHTEKERVFQWVKRYIEPSSSVGGRLINKMRETHFNEGFECPHCASEHVVRFEKYNGCQRYRCKYRIKSNDGKHVIKGLYLSRSTT